MPPGSVQPAYAAPATGACVPCVRTVMVVVKCRSGGCGRGGAVQAPPRRQLTIFSASSAQFIRDAQTPSAWVQLARHSNAVPQAHRARHAGG